MVYIDMGNNSYMKYNPYYITESMLNKPIVVKMAEGEYTRTKLCVTRLYKLNEVNYRNSSFMRY